MKILILGGYGTFGGRLAALLADEKQLELVIAGRSREKAAAFCATLHGAVRKSPAAFDRDGDNESQLAALAPGLVVDATGPFQDYGAAPYRVVEACIARGIHYMDLADAADFVAGIAQFDAAARARGVFVLSGVSSFPVLTAAIVRVLARGMARIDTVTAGIAPSPYAGVGLNVIRAIASYAGKRVALTRDGRPAHAYGLVETMRFTIAPPGRLPLRNIRFSLVDVPELKAIPALRPDLRAVWAGAGPVPEILHRGLNALAWLVRLRLLPSLAPLAKLFHWAINHLRWGEHRGGMFVTASGSDERGQPIERSWHMVAEGDDGPLIPSMACAALIRRMPFGTLPAHGARAAVADLEFADYVPLFAARAITTGIRERRPGDETAPLFRRILGEAWTKLPGPVRVLHDHTADWVMRGEASVERGASRLSHLAGRLFGFPPAAASVPVEVSFLCRGGGEIWQRRFGTRSFESHLTEGRGRNDRLVCERFGPLGFAMALVLESGKLSFIVRRWSFLGLPLPLAWAPDGASFEHVEDGRFRFHVEIGHRLTGLIVRYKGWLIPADVSAAMQESPS